MAETWLEQLHQWHEFYILIGTAAATLTGLMFVVVSIGPQVIATRGASGVRAFVTPVMVHFTSVLAVSALMIVPLMTPGVLAVLLALGSLGSAVAIWREAASGFVLVAAAAILLLIVGIRNAWDLVIWMAQKFRG